MSGHRFWIESIAGKDLNGQGDPGTIAEQADDDLHFSTLAITVVAEGPEFIIFAFEVTARHVVEVERRIGFRVGLLKKTQLDVSLVLGKPSQVGIEVIFVESIQAKQIAAGVGAGQAHSA